MHPVTARNMPDEHLQWRDNLKLNIGDSSAITYTSNLDIIDNSKQVILRAGSMKLFDKRIKKESKDIIGIRKTKSKKKEYNIPIPQFKSKSTISSAVKLKYKENIFKTPKRNNNIEFITKTQRQDNQDYYIFSYLSKSNPKLRRNRTIRELLNGNKTQIQDLESNKYPEH